MSTRLHCSCAHRPLLKNVALEDGLPAAACPDCGAVLLNMDDWRRWRSRAPELSAAHVSTVTDTAADHGRARACPACTRLMERLPVDAAEAFRVDRCGPCQLVWLDPGEWQALVQGDKFDRTRAQLLLEDKTRAIALHSPEVVSALADFYDSLRPEQQKTVREMSERRGWFRRG